MKRLIRVTSSALGVPTRLRVYVYDDANQMRRATLRPSRAT